MTHLNEKRQEAQGNVSMIFNKQKVELNLYNHKVVT